MLARPCKQLVTGAVHRLQYVTSIEMCVVSVRDALLIIRGTTPAKSIIIRLATVSSFAYIAATACTEYYLFVLSRNRFETDDAPPAFMVLWFCFDMFSILISSTENDYFGPEASSSKKV